MLTVWSILWGDKYAPDYVYTLKRMVERHLTLPHRFACITDQDLPGIECRAPECDYPGWWQKIQLFKLGVATGPSLYLDLDVVIVDELDYLVQRYQDCELAMPQNWAQSGHGGCQSSLMIWRGNSAHQIWGEFDPAEARWPPVNDGRGPWGDQEHITRLRDEGRLDIIHTPSWAVVSYKYHCRQLGPTPRARVVVFHGKPDPHEVGDPWVSIARS